MKDLQNKYTNKIKIFNEILWDYKVKQNNVNNWLENFEVNEKIKALYLLTEFIYYNDELIKELLVCIYRDLYKYPLIKEIRKLNSDNIDFSFLKKEFENIQGKTWFTYLGNPAESGANFMYDFRIHNEINVDLFAENKNLNNIKHIICIDDFCGSGTQAIKYSDEKFKLLKSNNKDIKFYFFSMIATKSGKENVLNNSCFDEVCSVIEIDDSYKCFSANSRVFSETNQLEDKALTEAFVGKYGKKFEVMKLTLEDPLSSYIKEDSEINKFGYKNGQLMLGFKHNTPDNTLPIFWYEGEVNWVKIFNRYNKK